MFRKKPSERDIIGLGEHIGRFINLLKTNPMAVILAQDDGAVLFMNTAAFELFKGLKVKLVGNKLPHFQPGSSILQWKIKTSRTPYIVEFNISPLILDDQNLCFLTLKSDEVQ
jgi:nitrogen-specific signal transduction histidine kinase